MKLKYPSKYQKKSPEYFEERRELAAKKKQELKAQLILERDKRKEEMRLQTEAKRKERKRIDNKTYRKKRRSEPYARRVEKINVKCKDVGKLSSNVVTELLVAQEGKCVYCGCDILDSRHIDHIVPLALGGSNTDDNIQLTCPKCNIDKGDTHPLLFKHNLKIIPDWLVPL